MAKPVKYPARLQKTLDDLPEKRDRHFREAQDRARWEAEERRLKELGVAVGPGEVAAANALMAAAMVFSRRRGF